MAKTEEATIDPVAFVDYKTMQMFLDQIDQPAYGEPESNEEPRWTMDKRLCKELNQKVVDFVWQCTHQALAQAMAGERALNDYELRPLQSNSKAF